MDTHVPVYKPRSWNVIQTIITMKHPNPSENNYKKSYELRLETAKQIHPAILGEISIEEAVTGLQAFSDAQEAVPQ